MNIRHLAFLTAATLGAAPLGAQFVPRSQPPTPDNFQFFAGISPLIIPFNIGEVEAEAAVGPAVTLGAAASYTEINNDRWSTAEMKLRAYTSNSAFQGLAIGFGVGLTRFQNLVTQQVVTPFNGQNGTTTSTWQSLDAPTVGMLVDYDWTPNIHDKHFVVGIGGELKRIVASDSSRARLGLQPAYISGRLVLGYAF